MKNTFKFFIISIIVLAFTGCGQEVVPPIYKWENYYSYDMKSQEKEELEKHSAVLNKIITESENEKRRVAPGLYAEYAQILFETGKKEEAKKYFILEKQIYPESTIFIDRVIKKLYGDM